MKYGWIALNTPPSNQKNKRDQKGRKRKKNKIKDPEMVWRT
jgi:hypothetical protein